MPIQQAPFPPAVVNSLALSEQEREQMTHFLQALVRTPSPSTQERAVAELIEEELKRVGVEDIRTDAVGNVIATIGDGNGPTILFDAHMDTVGITGDNWPHPPYEAKIVDDMLFGRGACDMKASIAAMVYAAKRLVEADTSLHGTAILIFVVQEEPCEGGALRAFVEEEGIKPDFVVLTEPSNLQLMRGQRGRVMLKIKVNGKASHASSPELGKNAIMAAARLIFGIDMLAADVVDDPFLGRGSIAVTSIESRAASLNAVPDECVFYVDRRLTLGETPSRVLNEIEMIMAREDIDGEVEVMTYSQETYTGYLIEAREAFEAWVLDKEHALVKLANTAAFLALGAPPAISHWSFSTDGVYSMAEAKIPTIGFGPGKPEHAHSSDEQVNLSDVAKAVHVYALVAAIVLGGVGTDYMLS